MKVWSSYEQVERAVETLKKIKAELGFIPPEMKRATISTLQHSYKGVVLRFFELCPPEIVKELYTPTKVRSI